MEYPLDSKGAICIHILMPNLEIYQTPDLRPSVSRKAYFDPETKKTIQEIGREITGIHRTQYGVAVLRREDFSHGLSRKSISETLVELLNKYEKFGHRLPPQISGDLEVFSPKRSGQTGYALGYKVSDRMAGILEHERQALIRILHVRDAAEMRHPAVTIAYRDAMTEYNGLTGKEQVYEMRDELIAAGLGRISIGLEAFHVPSLPPSLQILDRAS